MSSGMVMLALEVPNKRVPKLLNVAGMSFSPP